MRERFTRRELLAAATAVGAVASSLSAAGPVTAVDPRRPRFRYCLNTATIRGQNLSLENEVDLVAKAGYDGIEPWIREIEAYAQDGGNLKDLRNRIADKGLAVESAIGFAPWIVDDDAERKAGLEQAKRDMDLVRQIGGTRIAAPPAGATKPPKLDLFEVAKRYRALLAIGADIGVTPQVELWGFSANLSRLSEVVFVAVESGYKEACLLPDIYHVYKGGSEFSGLNLVAGNAMHCFHVNDYPADPPRETIADKDRVYPGDGVAPLSDAFRTLAATGFAGALSLELFNRDYWSRDALSVIRTGHEKMKLAVARAFE